MPRPGRVANPVAILPTHDSDSLADSDTSVSGNGDTNCSAVWSSLFTLESVQSYVPAPSQSSMTYSFIPMRNSEGPSDMKDFTLNARHQKLASALAIIGASSADSKSVTACSTEITFQNDSDRPTIIVRIAQNQAVLAADTKQLQDFVYFLVEEVGNRTEGIWSSEKDRHNHINSIAAQFLPRVIARCEAKISSILSEPYAKPFRTWCAQTESLVFLSKKLQRAFKTIFNASGDRKMPRDEEQNLHAVASAFYVLESKAAKNLESQWKRPSGKIEDDEQLEDDELLDPEDEPKSAIYRFLRKLARYLSASRIIVQEVVTLHRKGGFCIKVETVPIPVTNSTPSEEHEYEDLDSFLKERIDVDLKTLDANKINTLRKTWTLKWKDANLYLHAEMQLAVFYALNQHLEPVQGFIGVSKKCCWCCDFILKHLQNVTDPALPDLDRDRYTNSNAGPPLVFVVQGTNGRKYPQWVFPDPATHLQSHTLSPTSFSKVCYRFSLVREDMEKALIGQVEAIIPQLFKVKYESDSSGLSVTGIPSESDSDSDSSLDSAEELPMWAHFPELFGKVKVKAKQPCCESSAPSVRIQLAPTSWVTLILDRILESSSTSHVPLSDSSSSLSSRPTDCQPTSRAVLPESKFRPVLSMTFRKTDPTGAPAGNCADVSQARRWKAPGDQPLPLRAIRIVWAEDRLPRPLVLHHPSTRRRISIEFTGCC